MDGVRSPKFRLSLLGRFELSGPDGPLDLPHKKLAALLAYLACSAPNPQPRERLATVLWGSYFETQARQNLRQALFRLRQILGRDVLSSDGEKVFLVPGTVDCDAINLKALMREGSRDSLAAVIDLYKDRLLADVTVTEAAGADWLGDERERLERLALDTLVRLGELELQSGIPDRALAAASKAISINNLREDAHRLQIRALAAAGRRADALRHYEDVAKLLRSELDVEPDAATASLAYGLRHSQSAKAVEADPDARPSAAAPQPDSELPTGERKQITALYASLKESLELVGDPEEALRISDTVLKLMMEAVHRYEGTVSQVMGDGITALFGVPLAYEDHAVRACYAALQIQETVKRYTQAPEDVRHVPVFVRVGLHSGEVAIQPTATDERLQYRVMGQTMHRADRLAQIATPGTSLLSATTLRLAEGYVRVRVLKGAKIKSVVEPAYELVGAELTQTRFGARASRGLSRFIGRDAELSLLGRIQQLADSGHGQVAAVVGEAGVGKSRFVYEVARSYRLQGWLIVESGAAWIGYELFAGRQRFWPSG